MELERASGTAGKETALRGLRGAIARGDLAPGQRLIEAELAERYEVTRASLRAAIVDLAGEGLVERMHHRGARVRAVTCQEAIEITECRMVLEALVAGKAAKLATDEEIRGLRAQGELLRASVSAGDWLKYSEQNGELHGMIQQIAAQRTAAELLQRLRAQIVRHQFRLALQPGRPRESLPEHLAIIEAIAARNSTSAQAATRRHLTSVLDRLRQLDVDNDKTTP